MINTDFDVIIVGAGPSGSSAAYSLKNSGLNVAIFDKEVFPRTKICGDAIGLDVINQFHRMSPELVKSFEELAKKQAIDEVVVMSPNGNMNTFSIEHLGRKGYVIARDYFDNFFLKEALKNEKITFFEGVKITDYKFHDHWVELKTESGKLFTAKIILAADGAYSAVARTIAGIKPEPKHFSLAAQVYFDKVSFENKNQIGLYYLKKTLPGYLWIFPTHDGGANVGIGMMADRIKKEKIDLKTLLTKSLKRPEFEKMFANATQKSEIKTYGLPLGSRKLNISGERYLLLGDSASLIDPFLSEGIANAIRSGRFAAEHVLNCFQENKFSAEFNKRYDKKIYSLMGGELKRFYLLQKLFSFPFLVNLGMKMIRKGKLIPFFFGNSLKIKG